MAVNRSSVDEKKIEMKKSKIFFRIIGYISKYKLKTAIVMTIMLLDSLVLVVLPLLVENAIDVQLASRNIDGLVRVMIIYISLVIMWWIGYVIRVRIMARISAQVVLDVREEAFSHLQTLDLWYFDSRPTGKILSRLIGDIKALSELMQKLITTVVPNFLFLVMIVIAMFYLNPVLASGAVVSLPVIAVGCFLIFRKGYPMWYDFRQKESNLSGFLHESCMGMKAIQSMCAEKETKDSFDRISDDVRNHWDHAVRTTDMVGIVIDFSRGIGYFTLFALAIYRLHMGENQIGELVAFISYIGLFWQPVRALSNMYNQLSNHMAKAGRVFEMLDTRSDLNEVANASDMDEIEGDVEFDNVSFAYPDEPDRLILENVSFKVRKGETIALAGPTGAGKTTIINLIPRFYDPVAGTVRIDGKDISLVKLRSLRNQMGIMTQEPYLFDGTVMENILYGREGATEQEAVEASKLIGCDSFIMRMSDGYSTMVGDAQLSEGQKQLIALARIVLKNPRILILDEATSSIDTNTEMLVQKGILKIMEGRTSFVVAHRLSTIRGADRILVIDDKGIIEEGNHQELIKMDGHYAALCRAQFDI